MHHQSEQISQPLMFRTRRGQLVAVRQAIPVDSLLLADLLCKTAFDVVLLDIWLPGADGLDTLAKIRELENPPEVIMISGHGTIETAVRATKLGAYDFLEKPLRMERTLILVKNAIEAKKL